jgi:phosphoglycerate dehydrogenase-like enzyme
VTVPVVLHPRHPRGVAEAFRSSAAFQLVEPADDAGIVDALSEAPILVSFVWRPEFQSSRLGWVQSVSAGVEQFPVDSLADAGITLTSARGVHAPQVAEHVFALILAMTRGVGIAMRDAVGAVWRQRMGEELGGKTIGILGLGSIGEEVARKAHAWGLDVIGTKFDPAGYDGVARRVLGPEGTVEVCAEADIVVVVLPDTPGTRGIVDARALAALGAGWVVNVGRGAAIDHASLIEALERGPLRGAGLDVFETEPLPADSPLWSHPRVVLTPHTAGFSPRYGERLLALFEHNLEAWHGRGNWTNRVV